MLSAPDVFILPVITFAVAGYFVARIRPGMLPLRARIRRTIAVIETAQGPGTGAKFSVRVVDYRGRALGSLQLAMHPTPTISPRDEMLDSAQMRALHTALIAAADAIDYHKVVAPAVVRGDQSGGIRHQYDIWVEEGESRLVHLREAVPDHPYLSNAGPAAGARSGIGEAMLSSRQARDLGAALKLAAKEVGLAAPAGCR